MVRQELMDSPTSSRRMIHIPPETRCRIDRRSMSKTVLSRLIAALILVKAMRLVIASYSFNEFATELLGKHWIRRCHSGRKIYSVYVGNDFHAGLLQFSDAIFLRVGGKLARSLAR